MEWPAVVKTGINAYLYPMRMNPRIRFAWRGLMVCMTLLLVPVMALQAQDPDEPKVIQFSGKVVTDEEGKIAFLPYAVVAVKGTRRGTYSDISGFFSIVAREGETLVFSMLGYKDYYYTVPKDFTSDRYTMFIVMSKDTILLPEAVVYPWPDPDYFVQEFLAMDVHDDLEDIAKENLSEEAMEDLRQYLPSDGPEHTQLYFKTQSANYYAEGQIKPIQLFNAFAWKEFIEAWRRGDFKKKDKK